MGLNFQDVLRDVHDPDTHTLGTRVTSGGGQATVSILGNITVTQASMVTVTLGTRLDSTNDSITAVPLGNVTLSDSKTYIGLTTSTLGIGTQFIGLVTVAPHAILGNLTLSNSNNYIGLVTAWSRNAGTTKTLISLPVGLGNNSIAVVATPTNANRIFVTNLLLSSNVTTEVTIRSGVTYLTGNATLGVTLFPGGGFELPGAPDSPAWIGLPSGALTIEKRDPGGTVSKIGGGVVYFEES